MHYINFPVYFAVYFHLIFNFYSQSSVISSQILSFYHILSF